jgi:solute carrier family 13 (sodium-dependent dicarboxylate transporter), member 2/3/5
MPMIAFAFALFGLVLVLPTPEGLSPEGHRAGAVFILCVLFWVFQIIPLQITSIMAIVLLPLTGVMSAPESFSLFGNEAVFFILGAFFISAVLVESGLSTRITCKALQRAATTPRRLRMGILFFGAFASFWMSEHAVAAMMYPIVLSVVAAAGLTPNSSYARSLFLAMAWGCIIGGIATYLGGARNPLAMGILYEMTGERIGFAQWLIADIPVVLVMLAAAVGVLHFQFPTEEIDLKRATDVLQERISNLGPMGTREKGVAAVTLGTIFCWVFLHGAISLGVTAMASVAVFFILRLTSWREIERSINWGVFLMYGGAIALGQALSKTGAADWLVHAILHDSHPHPLLLLAFLIAITMILTEFISNAAVVSLMMPVAISLARPFDMSPIILTFAVALPSGLTFILPMGTPANAIALGSGYPKPQDFFKAGAILVLFAYALFMLAAAFWWPLLGYKVW